MDKSPIEIAIGQTNILIEDEVCKAVGKVGIHINKEELLKALKAYEFVEELTNYIFEYPDDDYMTMECLCRKLHKHGLLDKVDGYYQTHEIRTNTHECVKDTHDKTEPNNSEKPNNCEPQYEMGMGTLKCDNCSEYGSFKCTKCDGEMYFKRLEPKDEPQTCDTCKYGEDKHRYAHICNECGVGINNYEPRTERNK